MGIIKKLLLAATISCLLVGFAGQAASADMLDNNKAAALAKKYIAYRGILRCAHHGSFKDSVPGGYRSDPGYYVEHTSIAIPVREAAVILDGGDNNWETKHHGEGFYCNSFMHQAASALSPGTSFHDFITGLGYKQEGDGYKLANANEAVKNAVISKYRETSWPTDNPKNMPELAYGNISSLAWLPEESRYWIVNQHLSKRCESFKPADGFPPQPSEYSNISIYQGSGNLSTGRYVDRVVRRAGLTTPCPIASDVGKVHQAVAQKYHREQANAKRQHAANALAGAMCSSLEGDEKASCEKKYREAYEVCYPREYQPGVSDKPENTSLCISQRTGGAQQRILRYLREAQDGAQNITPPTDVSATVPDSGGIAEKRTCGSEVTGVGYLLCPGLDTLATVSDGIWKSFEGLLKTNPLKGQSGDYLYEMWAGFRDLANAILAIVFLVIIASQVSGIGISNYGIKKMIPRVIIAAVAINASFILMQVVVDLANVLGKTLYDLIVNAGGFNTQANLDNIGLTGLIEDIIFHGGLTFAAGAGIAAGIAAIQMPAALIFVALIMLPAVPGFIAGMLALAIRSALIPVIAVIAPIAIAAYVLPNTQGLFDKWRKTTTAMLSLYPLASVYYGGLKLAALIMISTGSSGMRLIGMVVLMCGAAVVLVLAVKANAITGKITGAVKNGLGKLTAPVQSTLNESFGPAAKEGIQSFKYGRDRKGLFGAMQKGMRSFDRSKRDRALRSAILENELSRQHAESFVADPTEAGKRLKGLQDVPGGAAYIREQEAALVKQQEVGFRASSLEELEKSMVEAIQKGNRIAAQAIQNVMLSQGGRGLEAFNKSVMKTEPTGEMRTSLVENLVSNHGSALMKDFATRQWTQSGETMAAAQAAWTGPNKNTDSISAKDFSDMSSAAQLRVLGASVGDDGNVTIAVDKDGNYGGRNLDNNALRALLDSSTDLGEGIAKDSPVAKALQKVAAQRGITAPGVVDDSIWPKNENTSPK
ncbi:MAG: hypothetical protein Q4B05_03775 [Candidatus Saccharibacteria bacterium]|nr:hypothetical protein [Candidatus Saccharibacteria bacterium]